MAAKYRETWEDTAKKYGHSFCTYDGELIYVIQVSYIDPSEPEKMRVVYTAEKAPKVNTSSDTMEAEKFGDLTFDSMFFNNGELNEGVPATYFSRSPRRQWKRGLTTENTRISCPLAAVYKSFGKSIRNNWDGTLSFKMIRRLQNPTYPTLEQALAVIDKVQSVAISPMFAVTLSNQSDKRYLLASPFGFIGEVEGTTLYIRHRPALQEVRDFVNRSKQRINVELVNA